MEIKNEPVTPEQRQRNIEILESLQKGARFYAYRPNPYDRAYIAPNEQIVDPGPRRERCTKTKGAIFVFIKGSQKLGYRWDENSFINTYVIIEPPDEGAEWHKRLRTAISRLEKSGLWPDVKRAFENLDKVSYEDWVAMRNIESGRYQWSENENEWQRKSEEEMDEERRPYFAKYPFCYKPDNNGHLQPEAIYLNEMSECRLKPMYFGKGSNKAIKEALRKAINDRTGFASGRIKVSYDVSVEYDPAKNAAWYSEEYLNAANGHYYLALDHMTALFCEDD